MMTIEEKAEIFKKAIVEHEVKFMQLEPRLEKEIKDREFTVEK